ncbi:MAG: pyridoxal-phosphate dependent enzyme [Chloroflexota bacterium]
MGEPSLERDLAPGPAYAHAVERFRAHGIRLPTFAQLADPSTIPASITARLAAVDPDAPDPLNLFRVHWFNGADRRSRVAVPEHLVLPESLTGVAAPIVVLLGDRFPLIGAHKVLAAYSVLAPRVVTGRFDPTSQCAVWPSTGNYCRGGVAISRIMGCHGVAILPEGMSRERFDWLERWCADPATDIVRTPGTESNVKEIYDACAVLARDPANVILNQFAEMANHLGHLAVTGRALEVVVEALRAGRPGLRPAVFVSATGSAGTIGAGDHLKDRYGTRIAAVEALECPTLLENGFGEHHIQGIGDKHVPLIHNVMNTDLVVGVSDRATDQLLAAFDSQAGRDLLVERGVPAELVGRLGSLGLSSIANVIAAIKLARTLQLGPDDAIVTVATDGAPMYGSELRDRILPGAFPGGVDAAAAAGALRRWIVDAGEDGVLELTPRERRRVFNLGYYTWVEQQGAALADFEARRSQDWWRGLRSRLPAWDALIEAFNAETGVPT